MLIKSCTYLIEGWSEYQNQKHQNLYLELCVQKQNSYSQHIQIIKLFINFFLHSLPIFSNLFSSICFVLQPSNIFLFIFINIFRSAAFQYFFLVRRSDKDRRLWAGHRPHSGRGGRVLQRLQPIPQTHRPSGDHSVYESRTSTATVNTHTCTIIMQTRANF